MEASTVLYVAEHVTEASKNLRATYDSVMKIRHLRAVTGSTLDDAQKIWEELYALETRLGKLLIDSVSEKEPA